MAKSFAGTVKQVLGTCLSLGCTVDKQNPKQVIAKLNNGELKVWFDFYLKKYRNSFIFNNSNNERYNSFANHINYLIK